MGLREDVQRDLAEAFDTDLADVVVPVQGGRTVPGQYDPGTEETSDPLVVSYTGRGVIDGYENHLIDGVRIRATDKKLIALINEIVGGVPHIDDEINGFTVINVKKDPADASYEIQLRKV